MSKKKFQEENLELNVAAMLDMAFQLLTFFILTFKGSPLEGQISLHMPPPQTVLGDVKGQAAGSDATNKDPPKPVATLLIAVDSSNGEVEAIQVGIPGNPEGLQPVDAARLQEKLEDLLKGSAGAFEQVVIEASPRLAYRELMRIVEITYKAQVAVNPDQKVGKLSFVSKQSIKSPGA